MRLISQHGQLDGSTGGITVKLIARCGPVDSTNQWTVQSRLCARQLPLRPAPANPNKNRTHNQELADPCRRLPTLHQAPITASGAQGADPSRCVGPLQRAVACNAFRFARRQAKISLRQAAPRTAGYGGEKGCRGACRQRRASDIEHHRQQRVVAADPTKLDHARLSKDVRARS